MNISLYYRPQCPYCQKVINAFNDELEQINPVNINHDRPQQIKLLQGGGKLQVPALLIEEKGNEVWLYESDAIINWLRYYFKKAKAAA